MKITTFTDTMIRKLKPENKKYIRGEGNGFTIRVLPSGVKTWLYIYSFDDKRREMNLGIYPEVTLETARNKFEDARKKMKNGIDPIDEIKLAKDERRKAHTVAELVNEFIERHAKKKTRNWKDTERMLNKEVVQEWGKLKARDITKRDVNVLLEKIVDRGSPATSNQVLKITRKMFNFAIEQDILKYSPCLGVKLKAKETSRERNLSEEEIKTLWKSLEACAISDDVRRAILLVLVTAQRPGEVSAMHRGEIDETERWWTIPGEAIYTAQAKNHLTHRVYLTDTALKLIGSLKMIDKESGKEVDKGYIFPCPHSKKAKPIDTRALAHAVRRNLMWPVLKNGKPVKDDKGKLVTENRIGIEGFTPHDLRRTATTLMAKCKIIREHRERVLNHKLEKLDGTYNIYDYDDEKKSALETLERKLLSIVSDK
jgi:integrase